MFCGYGEDDEGKQKRLMEVFEPMLPLVSGLYRCDDKFHTEELRDQLNDKKRLDLLW